MCGTVYDPTVVTWADTSAEHGSAVPTDALYGIQLDNLPYEAAQQTASDISAADF